MSSKLTINQLIDHIEDHEGALTFRDDILWLLDELLELHTLIDNQGTPDTESSTGLPYSLQGRIELTVEAFQVRIAELETRLDAYPDLAEFSNELDSKYQAMLGQADDVLLNQGPHPHGKPSFSPDSHLESAYDERFETDY